jgi:hypothetical protein
VRTILNAIMDAANCAEQDKKGLPTLRGVAIRWVELPDSEVFYRPVLRCTATDGKAMAVTYCDPGDNAWPQHDEIIVSAEGIKVLGQLLKRVDKIVSERAGLTSPVKATLETWCDAVDQHGGRINERQVLRVDVPVASDGVVVPLVGKAVYPNIEAVMTKRRVWLGTPKGILNTGYIQSAQEAVGYYGPPLWYTDDRSAFLFNKNEPERAHDFALVMPCTDKQVAEDLWPWGRPDGTEAPAADLAELDAVAQAMDGDLPVVVTGLDDDELPTVGPDLGQEKPERPAHASADGKEWPLF